MWNSTQMQRRIVFIVNAIFKCLPNPAPVSFLLVLFYSEVLLLYNKHTGLIKSLPKGNDFLILSQGARVCEWGPRQGKPVGLCPSCIKREGHPLRTGPAYLCSVFRFRSGLSCVCTDTGIFTLAKQGSCIDLCDCDEFGIVI